jgi:membrane associated rhomboid family serine protease
MSIPRRQTPMPPQMWATGRPTASRILFCILCSWGAAQLSLWCFGLTEMSRAFAADGAAVGAGEFWRLVTSQLFHVNATHFVLTVGAFYFAGREVEPIMGRRAFLGMCFSAGVLGALASCLAHPTVPVWGFSAATAAVIAAYATILPELEHRIWLFAPRPLRIRAKTFLVLVLAFAASCLLTRTMLSAGPVGILLGAALGWIWARRLGFGNAWWFARRRMERMERDLRFARMTPDEFLEEEVDPILEKISRTGMESLTREERRTLETARGKLLHPPLSGE